MKIILIVIISVVVAASGYWGYWRHCQDVLHQKQLDATRKAYNTVYLPKGAQGW